MGTMGRLELGHLATGPQRCSADFPVQEVSPDPAHSVAAAAARAASPHTPREELPQVRSHPRGLQPQRVDAPAHSPTALPASQQQIGGPARSASRGPGEGGLGATAADDCAPRPVVPSRRATRCCGTRYTRGLAT